MGRTRSVVAVPKQDKSLVDGFDHILDRFLTKHTVTENDQEKNPFGWVDIITFAESEYYLNVQLYPWQRLILKVMYMGTRGNQFLAPTDGAERCCANCVWAGEDIREPYKCIMCRRFDPDRREETLRVLAEEYFVEEADELRDSTLVDNFSNEVMLIEKDLADTSDATFGGSVREQFKKKIGNTFTELVLVLGRRSGKALALDTPILTVDGWKTMVDVEVGDRVFGRDGLPTRVIATTEVMEDRPCYEITFSNGEVIVCDEQHEWPTIDKRERKNSARDHRQAISTNRTTKEISETAIKTRNDTRRENNHAIQLGRPIQYPASVELPVEPYLMGVWVGDGNRRNGGITITEDEIVSRLRNIGHVIQHQPSVPQMWWVKSVSGGESLNAILRKNCISGRDEKIIPVEYQRASASDRLLLLQGLMDTDGSVGKGGACEFTTIYEGLSRQVLELVVSLGIKATVIEGVATLNGRQISPKYRVIFTPPEGLEVCSLPRKLERLNRKRKSDIGRVFIESIRKLDRSVPVKCIQVDNRDHIYLAGRSLIPTHNSMMVSIVALYEAYKLIQMGHPQKYYRNLSEGDTITILNVAPSEKAAKEAVFDKIVDMISRSAYFKSKISPGTMLQREVRFLTPRDQELNEKLILENQRPIDGTIYLLSGHSNSDSLVGKTALVIIVDEMASLNNREGSKMSDAELYVRLKNCTLTFRDQAKIMCISSPMTKEGQFFSLYERSFRDDHVLMVQLPSWTVNPTITEEWLKEQQKGYIEQGIPHMYTMEIESRFLGGASSPLLPAEKVDEARERGKYLQRIEHGDPRKQYFAHADAATNSDNYAFAILHVEDHAYVADERGVPLPVIYLDHVQMWSPERHTDGSIEPVNIAEADEYIIEMHKRFHFLNLSYDQWSSDASIQKMQALGMPVQKMQFTAATMSVIYGELLSLFLQDRIVLYSNGDFADETADQLKFLQKRYTTKGHHIEAVSGHHDDIPACLAGAAHMATSGIRTMASLPKIRTRRFAALNGH